MSRDQIFIFVEGRDLDPDIYSKICAPICEAAGKNYEIIIADRFSNLTPGSTPVGGGGKKILTLFFEHLRDNHCLVDQSGPNAKLSMFYLDKDVDDVLNSIYISDHIVYTQYYCIENHLFCEGNLVDSIATAGSIDVNRVRSRIPDPKAWRQQASVLWRDWIALCLAARKLKLTHPVSYSINHPITNSLADSLTNRSQLFTCISQMHQQSGLAIDTFNRRITWAYLVTDRMFHRANHDLLFKGKWYRVFALRELDIAAGGRIYNKNGATDRLMGSLIASTPFNGQWTEHFTQPLQTALTNL
jgi:hypothetical protein